MLFIGIFSQCACATIGQLTLSRLFFWHTGIVLCHQQNYLMKLPFFSDSLCKQLQQAVLLEVILEQQFYFDVTKAILLVHHLISVLSYMCIHLMKFSTYVVNKPC